MTCESNQRELAHEVDTIDELQEIAEIPMVSYQQKIANTYNKHVHILTFQVGDLVLRNAFQNTMDVTDEKFNDTWEGPYLIDDIVEREVYQLSTMDGVQVRRSWNVTHLKKYHMQYVLTFKFLLSWCACVNKSLGHS